MSRRQLKTFKTCSQRVGIYSNEDNNLKKGRKLEDITLQKMVSLIITSYKDNVIQNDIKK